MILPRNNRRRRGAAAVEFAVIAPFLVAMAVGMMEITRAIQVKNYLSDAARAACRHAAVPGSSTATVNDNVKLVLANYGVDSGYATVTVKVNDKTADANTAKQNDKVSVEVSIPVNKVGWVSPYFVNEKAVTSEKVTMLRQG